jgi:hypothetical protein
MFYEKQVIYLSNILLNVCAAVTLRFSMGVVLGSHNVVFESPDINRQAQTDKFVLGHDWIIVFLVRLSS